MPKELSALSRIETSEWLSLMIPDQHAIRCIERLNTDCMLFYLAVLATEGPVLIEIFEDGEILKDGEPDDELFANLPLAALILRIMEHSIRNKGKYINLSALASLSALIDLTSEDMWPDEGCEELLLHQASVIECAKVLSKHLTGTDIERVYLVWQDRRNCHVKAWWACALRLRGAITHKLQGNGMTLNFGR